MVNDETKRLRKMVNWEKPCPKCVTNVAMGFFFKICNESLSDKLDCNDLTERYIRGEINAEQIVKEIKDAARDDSSLMEDLNEIDHIRKTKRIDP
ncbi:hypothetical protein MUP77_13675 [Candidatus Bathyarchaeota archaeon]|nr:hypothetical protein [Candidatus Bathyarchaeota archaeon]